MHDALYTCRFVQFAAVMLIFGVGSFRCYAVAGGAENAASVPAALDTWAGQVTRPAAILALLSALALLLCQSAVIAGSPGAALDPATVTAVLFETRFGRIWFWHLLVAIFLVLACLGHARGRQPVVLLLSLVLLASLGWIGHAATGEGAARIARTFNQTIHLLAAGLWLGGLAPLAWLLRRARMPQSDVDAALVRRVVRRFSQMGYAAVAVIALTGAISSLLLVGSFGALVATPYGRLLGLKILLFLAMVAVALVNRFRFAPRLAREAAARRALYRTVGLEQGLGLCVLAVVSVLGTLPPGIDSSGQ